MAETQHAEEHHAEEATGGAAQSAARSGAGRQERRVARLAKQIRSFAASHGGGAQGHISYLGQRGVRIVLVGENGEWGDLVAPSRKIADAAVERADLIVHEKFDGAMAEKMRTGRYEWSRMAGIQLGGPSNG